MSHNNDLFIQPIKHLFFFFSVFKTLFLRLFFYSDLPWGSHQLCSHGHKNNKCIKHRSPTLATFKQIYLGRICMNYCWLKGSFCFHGNYTLTCKCYKSWYQFFFRKEFKQVFNNFMPGLDAAYFTGAESSVNERKQRMFLFISWSFDSAYARYGVWIWPLPISKPFFRS